MYVFKEYQLDYRGIRQENNRLIVHGMCSCVIAALEQMMQKKRRM
jgi:hypothetical protein